MMMPKPGYKTLTVPEDTYKDLQKFRTKVIEKLRMNVSLPEAFALAVFLATKWIEEHPEQLPIMLYMIWYSTHRVRTVLNKPH
jgi:hypothetical protein